METRKLINLLESHEVRREYKINHSKNQVSFQCSKCNLWKDFSEFSRDNKPSLVIPFRNDCKTCQNKHILEYYRENENQRAVKNRKGGERKKAKRDRLKANS